MEMEYHGPTQAHDEYILNNTLGTDALERPLEDEIYFTYRFIPRSSLHIYSIIILLPYAMNKKFLTFNCFQ